MRTTEIAGTSVVAVGIGTWHMGDDRSRRRDELEALQAGIDAALEHGRVLIDTVELYGDGRSERLVGEAIKRYAREDLFVVDKVLPSNASRDVLPSSLATSLRNLGLDHVDLYLHHWRGSIPLIETVVALEAAVASGQALAWANYDVDDLAELDGLPGSHDAPAANEVLYNLGSRGIDFALLPEMREREMPLIAYSPVAQGDSIGPSLTRNRTVREVARAHDATAYQVLLAWTIRDGNSITIPQTASAEHAAQNIAAGELELTDDDLALLDKAFPPPRHKERLDSL